MLTVHELSKPNIERAHKNHETYKMLYGTCVQHIKRKHAAECTTTIYTVPEFVLGRPTYQHTHAVRYVSEKLRRGGFDVHTGENGILTIDWSKGVRKALKSPSQRRQKPERSKTKEIDGVPLSVRLANLSKSLNLAR